MDQGVWESSAGSCLTEGVAYSRQQQVLQDGKGIHERTGRNCAVRFMVACWASESTTHPMSHVSKGIQM